MPGRSIHLKLIELEACDKFSGLLKSLVRLQKTVISAAMEALTNKESLPGILLESAQAKTQTLESLLERLKREKILEGRSFSSVDAASRRSKKKSLNL